MSRKVRPGARPAPATATATAARQLNNPFNIAAGNALDEEQRAATASVVPPIAETNEQELPLLLHTNPSETTFEILSLEMTRRLLAWYLALLNARQLAVRREYDELVRAHAQETVATLDTLPVVNDADAATDADSTLQSLLVAHDLQDDGLDLAGIDWQLALSPLNEFDQLDGVHDLVEMPPAAWENEDSDQEASDETFSVDSFWLP